jgi:DNA-binding IclR family transcriptional regulator
MCTGSRDFFQGCEEIFLMLKNADRTLDLFEVFARTQKPLTLSELARELKVAPSSCSALIKALRERGYLYAIGERRTLYPTRRMLDQVTAIAATEPHVARLLPIMTELRDETNESVILGRREGNSVVYLQVCESRQTVRYSARVGDVKPLSSSAIGKALLSSMSPIERTRLIQSLPRRRITANTLCTTAEISDNIETGLERGYQLSMGENVIDVIGVAMPVVLGGDVFGICVAGPMHRMRAVHARHAKGLKRALRKVVPPS